MYSRDAALMAIDASRTAGGTAVVAVADTKREVEIRLGPLVRVHGKFESKGPGQGDFLDQCLYQFAAREDSDDSGFVDEGRILGALAARGI